MYIHKDYVFFMIFFRTWPEEPFPSQTSAPSEVEKTDLFCIFNVESIILSFLLNLLCDTKFLTFFSFTDSKY